VSPRGTKLAPRVFLYAAGAEMEAARPSRGDGLWLPQHPSAAFGDGSHPTTRLCARAVDLLCRQRRPASVLDVGTGTGVLARIARAHGASYIVATDIDPVALVAAQANAALDAETVTIEVSDRAPDTWGARFDLVVANILEGPLLSLAPQLHAALAPGGALLLSGFTPAQTPALRATYARAGLAHVVEAHLDGWALLQLSAA